MWRIYAPVTCAIFGSDNNLSSFWFHAIIWTNDGLLSVGSLGRNFSGIWVKRQFALKMHRCLGLSVITKSIPSAYFLDCTVALKTKGCQFDNFVVTDGTVSCHYDNLRCHQWRQNYQINNLLFSMIMQRGSIQKPRHHKWIQNKCASQ